MTRLKRILLWIIKLAICAGLGYLGYRYVDVFVNWITHGLMVYIFWIVMLLVYMGIAYGFAWLDGLLGLSDKAMKPKLVRASICALFGLPVVVKGVMDFIHGVHGQGYVGLAILLVIHIGFAGMLFPIGFGDDETVYKR